MRGWKFWVEFYARDGLGARREIFGGGGERLLTATAVQGLFPRGENQTRFLCTMTDSTRVDIRHSAAILGCVLRLGQRIEATCR
jgi:hypothetical protein